VLLGYLVVMLGLVEQHAPIAGLSAILVALFEFSLGLWLVFKGFNAQAVARLSEPKPKN
jgi:hypothetical protein